MKAKDNITFFKSYDKLKANSFTCVRWIDRRNYYVIGSIVECNFHHPYYHKTTSKGFFRILRIEHKKLSDISDDFIKIDSETDREGFYKIFTRFYTKKPNWKEWDSVVQILYLERVPIQKSENGVKKDETRN